MRRVRLLHWKAPEAQPIVARLQDAGFSVDYQELFAPALMKQWRESPPDVFVIDLSRLPSDGREIAIALRQSPKTCAVPVIFLEGEAAKVEKLRNLLPDATYTSQRGLVSAVRRAKPLADPARPLAMMDRFAGRSVAQKLGITVNSQVLLMNPPHNVAKVLGPLPSGVEFVEASAPTILCFVDSVDDLRRSIGDARGRAAKIRLWILWRKKSAPSHNGVTETMVRETGLALGLVDYKICSVDQTWSALLFAKRNARPEMANRIG